MLIIIINDDHTSRDSSHFAFTSDKRTATISQSVPICHSFLHCTTVSGPLGTICNHYPIWLVASDTLKWKIGEKDLPLYTWQTLMWPFLRVNLGLPWVLSFSRSSCSSIHSSIFAIITSSASANLEATTQAEKGWIVSENGKFVSKVIIFKWWLTFIQNQSATTNSGLKLKLTSR